MDTGNKANKSNEGRRRQVQRYDQRDFKKKTSRVTKGERSGSPGHKGGGKDSGG